MDAQEIQFRLEQKHKERKKLTDTMTADQERFMALTMEIDDLEWMLHRRTPAVAGVHGDGGA